MPVIIGLALLAAGYLAVSTFVASVTLRVTRRPLEAAPPPHHEDVSFSSRVDGLDLRGWCLPGGQDCVIIVNGGAQNRVDSETGTLELATDLWREGYSVLLFDFRGRGQSTGEGSILPHNDRDVGGAVDFIRGRQHGRIFIIGFSAGAAAALIFAIGDTVNGIVSDSCFARVRQTFAREARGHGYPAALARIFTPGAILMAQVTRGARRHDPVDVVGQTSTPLLFIHGEDDSGVPLEDAHRLHRSARQAPSFVWTVPGAEHTQSYHTDPAGYVRRVVDFFRDVSPPVARRTA